MAVVLRCEACAFITASTFTLSHWGSISIRKRRKTRVLIDLVLDEREILPGAITISQSHLTHLRRHQSPQGVARSVRPHSVIFLGYMMDNGFSDIQITECMRSSSFPPFRPAHLLCTISRYQEYVERFFSIFSASPSLPVYCLLEKPRKTTMLALGTVITRQTLQG